MSARILDGKELANRLMARLAALVAELPSPPCLAVVLVGGGAPARTHARFKHEACLALGMRSLDVTFPEQATQAEVEGRLRELAQDPSVHGIFLQYPLPPTLDAQLLVGAIPPEKDVDACHPVNQGLLATPGGQPFFLPATAAGCQLVLEEAGIPIRAARAAVLGTDHYAAIPAALILLRAGASVELHGGLAAVPGADIVVAAAGPLTGEMIKPGAAVIDLGVHRTPSGLVGDVEVESVQPVAALLTPVPGGMGPVTVAMLMSNLLKAAKPVCP